MLRLGQFPRTFILHLSLTTLVAMLTWLSAQEAWALTAKQCAVLYSSWDADRNNDTTAGCSHNAQPAMATELNESPVARFRPCGCNRARPHDGGRTSPRGD